MKVKIKTEKDGIIERRPHDGENFDNFYTTNAVVRYNGYWHTIKPLDNQKEAEYEIGSRQAKYN